MQKIARKLVAAGAFALVFAAGAAKADQFINVLTGGTSGVYYPLGVALSEIYAGGHRGRAHPGAGDQGLGREPQPAAAGQGRDRLRARRFRQVRLGRQHRRRLPGKLDKLRGIAAIYPNYIQVVASQESGIKTLADLKGKSLSVGAPKSGTELNARAIFAAAGMKYEDLGKTEYLPFGESVELIKNRQLDATLQSAGLGVGSIKDLASSVAITVVAVPKADVEKIGSPYLAATIPAGTYEGQAADVPTLAITNILVTSADVSDEIAYQMTKQLFENLPDMVAAHNAAKAIDMQKALTGMPVPLHPGAERYYKEKGLM